MRHYLYMAKQGVCVVSYSVWEREKARNRSSAKVVIKVLHLIFAAEYINEWERRIRVGQKGVMDDNDKSPKM